MSTDIAWFRDDLRLADNPLLHGMPPPGALLCVYVLDERWLSPLAPAMEERRIGPARLAFLWQSLIALRGELLARGGDLLVRVGEPAAIIASLAERCRAARIHVRAAAGSDERAEVAALAARLEGRAEVVEHEGGTLLAEDALPFALEDLPGSYSAFRRRVERDTRVPPAGPVPLILPPWPDRAPRGLPALGEVCPAAAAWRADARGGFRFDGGEVAGLARLDHYLWGSGAVAHYKQTRNGLRGADFSTRLSPWLAAGCLSARQVHDQVRAWEREHGASESSYWVIFELLWREYFHWAARQGDAALYGTRALPAANVLFDLWREGGSGVPLIDAAMRELACTGWLSNRARQVVAGFLVKDLGVDWRLGAAWFEHCLIDYDAASNWGNWRYIAGVGRDPRRDRYFNVLRQAERYDGRGDYVVHWQPRLAELPVGAARHQPWRVAPRAFSRPVVEPHAWRQCLLNRSPDRDDE